MVEVLNAKKQHRPRYVPLVGNLKVRTILGFMLLIASGALAGAIFNGRHIETAILIPALAWLPAVFLTDKYVHKYPQRYFAYLFASHVKAAVVMAFCLWIIGIIAGPLAAPSDVLWTGFIIFVFSDALVSIPRRRDISYKLFAVEDDAASAKDMNDKQTGDSDCVNTGLSSIDTHAIVNRVRPDLDSDLVEFIKNNLPDLHGHISDVLICDDVMITDDGSVPTSVGLLVGRTRINHVRRLHNFLMFCSRRIAMGGYFVFRYMPLENVTKEFRRRHTGLFYWPLFILHVIWFRAIPKIPWLGTLYFSSTLTWLDELVLSLTKRRNRVLSKAEMWGRLAFCGMDVLAESKGDGELYIIAQRVTAPSNNPRPSYYPVVALEKVGLDGKNVRMHKIRSMFPFSEFIQKRVFQDHGLTRTGKFKNDFRLTEYGRFIRKYWLDELPQIYDWLRGEVKLVGMRATSRHFLSLYPRELYDLYIQVKPGLIPPIFDESTTSFAQIVKVELTYLQRYYDRPVRTDISYLMQTLSAIVFRGVRSR